MIALRLRAPFLAPSSLEQCGREDESRGEPAAGDQQRNGSIFQLPWREILITGTTVVKAGGSRIAISIGSIINVNAIRA
jgi:hypothetical protein